MRVYVLMPLGNTSVLAVAFVKQTRVWWLRVWALKA
jgi:hypothetical protein